jgi:NAD(P)-dependent dehydrogenase (short-subunit alcohol dehydrogenase family)
MAEGLVEAGGHVHCLDRLSEPDKAFHAARERIKPESGGSISYHQVDVSKADELDKTIADIADEKQRLDGLIAGIRH